MNFEIRDVTDFTHLWGEVPHGNEISSRSLVESEVLANDPAVQGVTVETKESAEKLVETLVLTVNPSWCINEFLFRRVEASLGIASLEQVLADMRA